MSSGEAISEKEGENIVVPWRFLGRVKQRMERQRGNGVDDLRGD